METYPCGTPREPAGCSRRHFLQTSLAGGLAALGAGPFLSPARGAAPAAPASRVALIAGDDRAAITFDALAPFAREVAEAIGGQRVVVKPNNVAIDIQLAATHAETIEGIFEFLKSIGKLENAVLAESAAAGPTLEGFANFGYDRLAEKYGVPMLDLDVEETETLFVVDETDFRPRAVRVSKLLLDGESFVISAAKMKTHDRVLATLSLKNIVFGAPVKDLGFRWGRDRAPGTTTQKPIAHGSGIYGINYNLFALAPRLHPHLAVIDAYDGMEGNGPTGGTAVDHRLCLVSPDWLAADRVGVELMGIDFAQVGYLSFCAEAGMGQADLERIEVLGEPIDRHRRQYRLHQNIEQQLQWLEPLRDA